MTEIKIGKSLQAAWQIFLKAPEIFTLLTLGYFAANFFLSRIPGVGTLIVVLICSFSLPAYAVIAEKIRLTGQAKFSDLQALVQMAPQLLFVSVLEWIFITIGLCLLILPGIYIAVIYTFAQLFVVMQGKTFWEAMEASRQLVNKNWFGVFGLKLFIYLLILTGFLLVGIGILVTGPLAALTLYCVFRDITEPTIITEPAA